MTPHSDLWGGFTNAVKLDSRRKTAGAYMAGCLAGHYVTATRARDFVEKIRTGLEFAVNYRANRPNVEVILYKLLLALLVILRSGNRSDATLLPLPGAWQPLAMTNAISAMYSSNT